MKGDSGDVGDGGEIGFVQNVNDPETDLTDENYFLCGELKNWPSKCRMAAILRRAGLRVDIGRYSIRIRDFEHFAIQEYGGDSGDPQLDADADCLEEITRAATIVSSALASARLVHRLEIYTDARTDMVGYLHHEWPLEEVKQDRA